MRLSIANGVRLTVLSDCCAWRLLRLSVFPTFQDLCRFSVWPPSLRLERGLKDRGPRRAAWSLSTAGSISDQRLHLATAAARVQSSCDSGHMGWLASGFGLGFGGSLAQPQPAASMVSALAHLADKLPSFSLLQWPVTAALLDEVVQVLPHTQHLVFVQCEITAEAWQRMIDLATSVGSTGHPLVSSFHFQGGPNPGLSLERVAALAAAIPVGAFLVLGRCVMSDLDWEELVQACAAHREPANGPLQTLVTGISALFGAGDRILGRVNLDLNNGDLGAASYRFAVLPRAM